MSSSWLQGPTSPKTRVEPFCRHVEAYELPVPQRGSPGSRAGATADPNCSESPRHPAGTALPSAALASARGMTAQKTGARRPGPGGTDDAGPQALQRGGLRTADPAEGPRAWRPLSNPAARKSRDGLASGFKPRALPGPAPALQAPPRGCAHASGGARAPRVCPARRHSTLGVTCLSSD